MVAAVKLYSRKLLLFSLLSAADFFFTWYLLRQGGGQVYESNPVANAWLATYGWVGLLIFKLSMVLLIGTLAVIISFYRPQTSDRLLKFACFVTGGVVIYSFFLSHLVDRNVDLPHPKEAVRFKPQGQGIDPRIRRQRRYQAFLHVLSTDLIAERTSLAGAVEKLERYRQVEPPGGEEARPGRRSETVRQDLADEIARYTLTSLRHDPTAGRRVAARLSEDYRSLFDRPLVAAAEFVSVPKAGPSRQASGRGQEAVPLPYVSLLPSAL